MLDPFTYWSRAMASAAMIGTTGRQFAETISAADKVVAARTEIIRSAMHTPWAADYAELSRMVPEKVTAFSDSGRVMLQSWIAGQTAFWGLAERTTSLFLSGRAPTPREAIVLWSRAASDALHAVEAGARTGRDTLAPIHKAATGNARRLRGR